MAVSVLYMSMSLDGYIAGPNDTPDNPGGDGFMRLHEWFHFGEGDMTSSSSEGDSQSAEPLDAHGAVRVGPLPEEARQLVEHMEAYGAIVAGRRTVEQVDHWGGNRHGVRIFVPSHRPPDPSVTKYPLVTYVTDGIVSAMAQAKGAAGEREVLVHGAYTAQRALEAGVLDELQIHQIPVLFGGGRRLFELLPSRIELEIVRVIDTSEATHIRYRVRR
ncbi:MAG: dihydrofolate reductase family protein [Caldilineaceae bacterium]